MVPVASSDLDELIRHGDLKELLSQVGPDKSPAASSSPNPPAFTKEKGATVLRRLYSRRPLPVP